MKFSVTSVVLLSGIAAASPITDSGAVARAAKKPFKQPAGAAQSLALCGNGKSAFDTDKAESEDCVGTLEFCNKKFFEKAGEKFADAKACLASREAAPSDDSVVFPDDPRLARNKGNKAPSNANKATANGPKKPFKERATSANFSELCGNSKFAGDLEKTRSEDCQGTLVFCNKKFYEKSKTGEKFASPQECLDSREKPAGAAAAGTPPANNKAKQPAQKKPFKQPASDAQFFDLCGNSKFAGDADKSRSEDCAGTLEFCNKKLFENTAEKFASPQECLDSREKPATAAAAGTPPANNKAKQPAQKKPFKQPASDAQFFDLCGNSKFAGDADKSRSEDCAGTLEFCNKKLFENTDEKFASAKACLDSRQAPK